MVVPVNFRAPNAILTPNSRELPAGQPSTPGAKKPGFEQLLTGALEKVDSAVHESDGSIESFLQGKTGIQEMALSVEKADLTFRLFVGIRNRVIEAYREISRINV